TSAKRGRSTTTSKRSASTNTSSGRKAASGKSSSGTRAAAAKTSANRQSTSRVPAPIARVTRVAQEVAKEAGSAVVAGVEAIKDLGSSVVERVTGERLTPAIHERGAPAGAPPSFFSV